MENQKYINKINSFFSKKYFTYTSEIYSFDYTIELTGEIKTMISIGEWTDFNLMNIKIFNLNDNTKKILDFIINKNPDIEINGDNYNVKKILRNLGVERELGVTARKILSSLKINSVMTNEILVSSSEVDGDFDRININEDKQNLNEVMIDRITIRTVVKDIVGLLKKYQDGFFNLPEDINGEPEYILSKSNNSFSVELVINYDNSIEGYQIPNSFYNSDDIIEILIVINPNDITKNLYNLIGELNEIITHELIHLKQNYAGELEYDDNDEGPLEYYTRTHEIPAQYYGFKRLSKLTKQPFSNVVKNWFETHQDIHGLNPNEQEIVINQILNYKQ